MGTYTYALLEVSKETFDEIEKKLRAVKIYDSQIHEDRDEKKVIDMHGLALVSDGIILVDDPLPPLVKEEALKAFKIFGFIHSTPDDKFIGELYDKAAEGLVEGINPSAFRLGVIAAWSYLKGK